VTDRVQALLANNRFARLTAQWVGAGVSDFDQITFGDFEFADNPEQRCPCVLVLDVSGSMRGPRIAQLNEGLRSFMEDIKADSMAAKRVELAIVTFGPTRLIQPFATLDQIAFRPLKPEGATPMGEAVNLAIQTVAERKAAYRANGVGYYRPWIFLITDGASTDGLSLASAAVREGEASKAFSFYAVGVEGADFAQLKKLSIKEPLKLRGLSFRELFMWLSSSLSAVSQSQPGDQVLLANPAAPDGWATAG
jgi:uncharacterized protein YegL